MSSETNISNNKVLERNKIKEEFKFFLENVSRSNSKKESGDNLINLGPSAVSSYLLFIEVEKLFDYNPEKWKHIESLYDITDSNTIKSIVDNLLEDDAFIERDKNDNSKYRSNALKHYYCFINAREFFLKNKKSEDKVHLPTNLPYQIIYYGAPGTGKSYGIKKNHGVVRENSYRTTFHPDTDYSSFVGCYKPIKENNGSNDIIYEFVPQVFTEAYIAAWRGYSEGKPIFLVIEEINRGNCAQIFGDLFQLLDRNDMGFSDYEIKPEKDLQQYLKDEFAGNHKLPVLELSGFEKVISGEELILPPNFNIIATMNTSDQSLFPIDSAFKRRWSWHYVAIKDYEEKNYRIEVDGIFYKWWDFVAQVNAKIKDVTESEDKKMGYFFVRPDKKEQENDENATIITTDNFVSKVLFYLWTDVFKDYADDVENNIFRKKLSRTEEGDKYAAITFSDFFDRDGKVNISVLKAFLSQFNLDSNTIIENEILEIEEQSSNTVTITVNGNVYEIGGTGSAEKIVSALLTLDKTDLEQVFNNEQNTKVLNGRCRLIDNELMPIDDPVTPKIQSNVYSQYRNSMKMIGDTGYYVQAYPPQRRKLFALLSNVLGSEKFSFIES